MILFGLINALVSFQKYINKILAKKLDIFVIVYLDDILIILIMAEMVMSQPYGGF